MSWALLLAKYPRSILKDEFPLLLLALLERAGLATENELSSIAGSDETVTRSTLLKLQLDGLVEYSSRHVRVTETGRQILDRFTLRSDVVEDILDSLALRTADRNDYRTLLESYRKSSFRLYQNSICTIRQWRTLSQGFPKDAGETDLAAESTAGMRSLLLRDLRNWIAHSGPPKDEWASLDGSLKKALVYSDAEHTTLYRQEDRLHNLAIFLLSALSAATEALPRREPWEKEVRFASTIRRFHHFQASWEPDLWFDKWVLQFKMPNPNDSSHLSGHLNRMSEALYRCYSPSVTPDIDWSTLFGLAWTPAVAVETLGEGFLGSLLCARSIQELVDRCGMSRDSAISLVSTIKEACSRLLDPETPGLEPPAAGAKRPPDEQKRPRKFTPKKLRGGS